MAVPILKGLCKIAIGGGALYVSVEQGIWGSSFDGSKTMNKLTGTLQRQDEYLRQIPSTEQLASNTRQSWNSGVKLTFSALARGPEKVKELGSQAADYVSGSMAK